MIAYLGVLTLLASLQLPWDNLGWREISPGTGGRVTAVAGTPQDSFLYYTGTAGGGVWKSTSGGAAWTPVFDAEPVAAIGAVAIDPTNENVVWVGTGESNPRNDVSHGDGLYKSTDGGKSWVRVGLAQVWSIAHIAIDPQNPEHVVVAGFGNPFVDSTDRGVYVTFDGGKTFTKTLYVDARTGASDVALDPQDPSIVYAGMWQFRRWPWTFRSGGPSGGLYKSSDGGRTWTHLVGNGLPAGDTGRIGIAVAPSEPSRVYAVIEAKGGIVWRSDDSGAHWQMVSDDRDVDSRPFYFSRLTASPGNPNDVYAVSLSLEESRDGGKTFHVVGQSLHSDFHDVWIDSDDPRRIIVGDDGGTAISVDGGATWPNVVRLPIGQAYHAAASRTNPYFVCAGFQDNAVHCGPSNSLTDAGIIASEWPILIDGDGQWAVPDPYDQNLVWLDWQDGLLNIYNRATGASRSVRPYDAFPGNIFGAYHLDRARYRFNWDSPIAFAPWDGHIGWLGGNAVFQTTDRGLHWTAISPDLTRNIKSHELPPGGPLVLDLSGAENSDTILYIEGSSLRRGEIWVGTDDGYVQLTRDGGRHWRNVTPPGTPTYARIEAVTPSPFVAGTAYATADNHRAGDDAPYVYATHDYGKSWTKIITGLPSDEYVRTIRPDDRDPNILYAGTENGIWISFDRGGHWQSFRMNLPPVSVRDIRIQPQFDDLVIATHGRGIWVLDDAASVQELGEARRLGAMLFAPRTAYEYRYSDGSAAMNENAASSNPPRGAIIDFYQANPDVRNPVVEILDARGHSIRTLRGRDVPNKPGINRVIWNFRENNPTEWRRATKKFLASDPGAMVVPGRYNVRLRLGGKTFEQALTVRPDPRDHHALAYYEAGYAFAKRYDDVQGRIDEILNDLDAVNASLGADQTANHDPAIAGLIASAQRRRLVIFHSFTADYRYDAALLRQFGSLRESIPQTDDQLQEQSPPTQAQLRYAQKFDAAYDAAVGNYDEYVEQLLQLSRVLQQHGLEPIRGARTVQP